MKDPVAARKYFDEQMRQGFLNNLSYQEIHKSFKLSNLPYSDKQLKRMISLYPTAENTTKTKGLFYFILFCLCSLLFLNSWYLYSAARTAGLAGSFDVILLAAISIITLYFVVSNSLSKYFSIGFLAKTALIHPFLLFLNNDFRFNLIIIISLIMGNIVGIAAKTYTKKAMPYFRYSSKQPVNFQEK